MYKRILITVLVFVLAGTGCIQNQPEKDVAHRIIHVLTTTGMITDAVRHVGGERVKVTGLMGPGVDPHLYKASEGDVRRMAMADIIIYNGLHLEGKLTEVLERVSERKRTVAAAEGIPSDSLMAPPEFSGMYDPHIWFDVRLWTAVVRTIRNALIGLDSTHADVYRNNAAQYIGELTRLDGELRQLIARIPVEQRILITAHDAFNYFGRAYQFRVKGLQGISTSAEAGARDVQELAQFIVDHRVPSIFMETSVPFRNIEALQAAVHARGFQVKIGGHLYSDALGDPNSPAGTYIGMIRHNVQTIVSSLMRRGD